MSSAARACGWRVWVFPRCFCVCFFTGMILRTCSLLFSVRALLDGLRAASHFVVFLHLPSKPARYIFYLHTKYTFIIFRFFFHLV